MEITEPFDVGGLKQYTQAKQNIAYQIRSLSELLRNNLGENRADECRRLMARLAEDRFILAVVGQFKRGKSSLMNAIIGQDLLPTGMLPLTSAITILKYGPRERLTIRKEGSPYPEEAPTSSLAEYVTEKENPGNMRKVASAVLELPVQFLRRNLEFVDTPGIGSALEANTATTYKFLPGSDAVIFVTSADIPLTGAETDFLRSIREHVRKVFFVVNKIDLAEGRDRQEILDFVSEILMRVTGVEEIRIFPVSSTLALQSKIAGEEEGYKKSGMLALEEALSRFLSNERSNVLLVSVLDKVLQLAGEAHHELTLLKMASETPTEESKETTTTLKDCFQTLRTDRKRSLEEVRSRVIQWMTERASAEIESFLAAESCVLMEEVGKSLSCSRWRLSVSAVQYFTELVLPHFKQRLEKWTVEETEHLDREILGRLRGEWIDLEKELKKIPDAAAQVFGGCCMEALAEESTEYPTRSVLVRSGFRNIEWGPKAPAFYAWLPVFATMPLLRSWLFAGIEEYVGSCGQHIKGACIKEVDEAIGRMGLEIEKRAAVTESHILHAVQGKRLTKGVDGRWQIRVLDKTKLDREMDALEQIESKLRCIRTWMLEGKCDAAVVLFPGEVSREGGFGQAQVIEEVPPDGAQVKTVDLPVEGPDLSRELSTRGCPVCNRMLNVASRFFADRQYALANDARAQRAHAASLGFCPLHTWQLEAMASPHGLSCGFPKLMERLSDDLYRIAASQSSNPATAVHALVQNTRDCLVCRLLRNAEEEYLQHLARFLQTPEGRKAYTCSQGVCIRHLGFLAGITPSKEMVQFLLQHAGRIFNHISEDMHNYALKKDALRGHCRNLDEEDAYLRGLIHSVGARKVCFPWEVDAEM